MTSRDSLCTVEEITTLVHQFYARIREDSQLGPIFNAHIDNWDDHLDTMASFWSSLLIGAGTYRGTPMPKHAALPDLNAGLFQQWLALFEETSNNLDNRQLAAKAQEYAHRIARSLWYGYQIQHQPNQAPSEVY